MEKVGTGIRRIKDNCKANDNEVEFNLYEGYFFVEISSKEELYPESIKGVDRGVEKGVESLNENQQKILNMIKKDSKITKKQMIEQGKLSKKSVDYNIAKLKQKRLLKREGSDRSGIWVVVDKND